MKLVPGPLPPIPTTSSMERLGLPLPFSPDLLWRYPLGFPTIGQQQAQQQPHSAQQPPSSPLLDYKSQLPSTLATDPRVWPRDDVTSFLRWAEREFDLQPLDLDMFQMNGKAICLLTRTDLSERAPGSGDVLYNVLQILVREANTLQRMLPSSPVTPTSRHHPYPLSPHTPAPTWNHLLAQSAGDSFHPAAAHAATLAAHLMAQSNSVTLSPAPSLDSQSGSPQHADNAQTFAHSMFNGATNGSNGSNTSNHSDSDEDAYDKVAAAQGVSPPPTPSAYTLGAPPPPPTSAPSTPRSPKEIASSPSAFKGVGREFFPNNEPTPEPNTNGRLLWDFLQQLLNDPNQRWSNYIQWKDRESGVFKIANPGGLAKLWGIQKNHLSMNYDKMSRALRYYYRVNILKKVQGERHCYQFLRNPSELKNIKNISLLRQMPPSSPKSVSLHTIPNVAIKPEPLEMDQDSTTTINHRVMAGISTTNTASVVPSCLIDYDEKPTDLTMSGPTDLSNGNNSTVRQLNHICLSDPPVPKLHRH